MRRTERDGDGECAAAPDLALREDGAAVQLDQLMDQGQANARPLMCASARSNHSVETVEHERKFVLRDSAAGVLHSEHSRGSGALQTDADVPLQRELERVRDEIQNDLLPHIAVDVDELADR